MSPLTEFFDNLMGISLNQAELENARRELLRVEKMMELVQHQSEVYDMEAQAVELIKKLNSGDVDLLGRGQAIDVMMQLSQHFAVGMLTGLNERLSAIVLAKITLESMLIGVRLFLLEYVLMADIRATPTDPAIPGTSGCRGARVRSESCTAGQSTRT